MPTYITIAAAFVAGALSGLGVGSAGLFVLYLTFALQMDQISAQGVNLVFFLLSAGASLLLHIKKRPIPWVVVGLLVVCAIPGSVLGTYLVSVLNRNLIRRLFGVMLVVSGSMALFRKSKPKESQPM